MTSKSFYVYGLKDPRDKNARIFYIGKGTGVRRYEHLKADGTRKGNLIKEIQEQGKEPIITLLAEDLTENQAFKLEAELVAAFGTIDSGGVLYNSVVPSINRKNVKSSIVVPTGTQEKAQIGLSLLKDSILDLAKANLDGVTNSDCVKALGLQANYLGGSKDYLTWSILGLLMQEGKMKRKEGTKLHIAQVR